MKHKWLISKAKYLLSGNAAPGAAGGSQAGLQGATQALLGQEAVKVRFCGQKAEIRPASTKSECFRSLPLDLDHQQGWARKGRPLGLDRIDCDATCGRHYGQKSRSGDRAARRQAWSLDRGGEIAGGDHAPRRARCAGRPSLPPRSSAGSPPSARSNCLPWSAMPCATRQRSNPDLHGPGDRAIADFKACESEWSIPGTPGPARPPWLDAAPPGTHLSRAGCAWNGAWTRRATSTPGM